MEIQINRNEEKISANKITILHGDVEFEIYLNQFGELIVRKEQYGVGESGIIVKPKVSNEIGLL